jgi:hypothetical protein
LLRRHRAREQACQIENHDSFENAHARAFTRTLSV